MQLKVNYTYTLKTPPNYSDDDNCWEVVWENISIPFDIICGLDTCPPDNNDYQNYKKTHWWVCPKTKKVIHTVHDLSMFIDLPESKEFNNIDDAVKYCINWYKNYLKLELAKLTKLSPL